MESMTPEQLLGTLRRFLKGRDPAEDYVEIYADSLQILCDELELAWARLAKLRQQEELRLEASRIVAKYEQPRETFRCG